jgi:diaminohydroxyphosphoribosylaminopyrimidine deaminase/5-amino-6-(5-phosphoribosylamino)uracil reductase
MPSTAETFMHQAVLAAERARGRTSPNPLVGCVVVKGGRVVGIGHHRRDGGPHAEIYALRQAGAAARGADVYTTLEPCCFAGRTGACTQALIEAGVKRVFAGMRDPNPRVAGGGLRRLRAAGIAAVFGPLGARCREQNVAYICHVQQGRPWVLAKWAQSLDGRVATAGGHSQWISGAPARRHAHGLRNALDAILVGRQTVQQDDPQLTCRRRGGRDPVRVVLDSQARISPRAQIVQLASQSAAPTLVLVGPRAPPRRCAALRRAGAEVVELAADRDGRPQIAAVLQELHRRGCLSLLVEGGPTVLGSFFDARLVDRLQIYLAPSVLGGLQATAAVGGQGIRRLESRHRLRLRQAEGVGDDLCLQYDVLDAPTKKKA